MKKGMRIMLCFAALAGTVVLMVLLGKGSDIARARATCTEVEIAILDSARLSFVTKSDVKAVADKELGVFKGKALDSINLKKIENAVKRTSAVMGCEAYMTDDGILHLDVTQREPAVRFKTPTGGYYADERGFIFPLHPTYTSDATVIEGDIPLNIPEGFKGEPASREEAAWLGDILGFVRSISSGRTWKGAFSKISVDKDGELVLYPVKGKERFLFGGPADYEAKLARMERYYTEIAPTKEEGWYKSVNVKYDNQIICKTK